MGSRLVKKLDVSKRKSIIKPRGRQLLHNVAKAFNTMMGGIGLFFAGTLSNIPMGTYPTVNHTPLQFKNEEQRLIGKAMTYLSPSAYVTGLITEGGLNPERGAETLSKKGEVTRALATVGDMVTLAKGPKVIKNTPKAVDTVLSRAGNREAKARTIARKLNDNINNTSLSSVDNSPQVTLAYTPVLELHVPTSLKFRKPSIITDAERQGIPRGERNNTHSFHIANYPGFQLKILMKGSPLERQISKNGTININSLLAQVNKASSVEKAVINKVLQEVFPGLKNIRYNLLKKAVQDELITYLRVPLTMYADYGISSLGFTDLMHHSAPHILFNEATGNFEQVGLIPVFNPDYNLNTFTFESPRMPYGSTKHYSGNTLGHSRTYTTYEEPDVLHVMESQSDWAQSKTKYGSKMLETYDKSISNIRRQLLELDHLNQNLEKGLDPDGHKASREDIKDIKELARVIQNQITDNRRRAMSIDLILHPEKYAQELYLKKNYLQRQIQENLRYAAEHGHRRMRYPTPETAAKIEGYSKESLTPEYQAAIDDLDRLTFLQDSNGLTPIPDEINIFNGESIYYTPEKHMELIRDAENRVADLELSLRDRTYSPEHQTILNKYADFPKQYKKLYGDSEVRTVTDSRGNTWYEVDVPKGFLNREWLYKIGGKLNNLKYLRSDI